MLWKRFQDQLAIGLLLGIITLLAVNNWLQFGEVVLGALILWGGMLVAFYFRKKE